MAERRARTAPSKDNNEVRTQKSSHREEEPLGDLRCDPSKGNVEILTSLDGPERMVQKAKFIVQDSARRHDDEVLFLCWVDSSGKLHHHYTYDEDGGMEHNECTCVGDAFVAFFAKKDTGNARPETASQLTDKSSGTLYRILFSYRVRREIDSAKFVHQISFSADGSCKVSAAEKDDDEYRIEARLPLESGACRLPPHDEPWEVTYKFVCPAVPASNWSSHNHTFYVWGDIDFDYYGPISSGGKGVHHCPMNQIVPQVMIGNCLASSDETFKPSWEKLNSWALQAQYFWQSEDGESLAICGALIRDIKPGDLLYTKIQYDCGGGTIRASIGKINEEGVEDERRRSEIISPKPFPHNSSLFKDWRDFFRKCQDADRDDAEEDPPCKSRRLLRGSQRDKMSKGPLGRPYLNVEYKGEVDVQTLKSICPFVVKEATYPGVPVELTSRWQAELFCPRIGRVSRLEDPKNGHVLILDDAIELDGKQGGTKAERAKEKD